MATLCADHLVGKLMTPQALATPQARDDGVLYFALAPPRIEGSLQIVKITPRKTNMSPKKGLIQ